MILPILQVRKWKSERCRLTQLAAGPGLPAGDSVPRGPHDTSPQPRLEPGLRAGGQQTLSVRSRSVNISDSAECMVVCQLLSSVFKHGNRFR